MDLTSAPPGVFTRRSFMGLAAGTAVALGSLDLSAAHASSPAPRHLQHRPGRR